MSELKDIFSAKSSVYKVIFFLSHSQNPLEYTILENLPPAEEIWMLRHPRHGRTPAISIPPHYCTHTRKLVLFATRVEWTMPQEVRLQEYSAAIRDDLVRLPQEAIPGSLQTLQKIQIDAGSFEESPPLAHERITLKNLRTIKTNIRFLYCSFIYWFQIPKVERIEFISPSLLEDWDGSRAASLMQFAQIKEIFCASMNERLESLAESLIEFKMVTRLELEGESVDAMLFYFAATLDISRLIFPSLLSLVITNYKGTGSSVVRFLNVRGELRAEHENLVFEMPKVFLYECSSISLETSKLIQCFRDVEN